MKTFFILIVLIAAIIGPAFVIAVTGYSSIKALGRNPSSAPKIMMAMVYAIVGAEVVAVIALLVLFQVFGK